MCCASRCLLLILRGCLLLRLTLAFRICSLAIFLGLVFLGLVFLGLCFGISWLRLSFGISLVASLVASLVLSLVASLVASLVLSFRLWLVVCVALALSFRLGCCAFAWSRVLLDSRLLDGDETSGGELGADLSSDVLLLRLLLPAHFECLGQPRLRQGHLLPCFLDIRRRILVC